MLLLEVSGKKKNSMTRAKPESHMSSQMVHVQPLPVTAKPPIRGPIVGPHTAAIPQIHIAYARFLGVYMSAIDAPPVARLGDPNRPVRNRKARSIPKLADKAVGI